MENKRTQLVGYYGSDESIALAAWTSTSREIDEDKKKRVPKLIESLYKNGHKTPFERGIVHFLVETDIASHIHLIKHRHIGTNGESARYKQLNDKYYIPEDWGDIEVSENVGVYYDQIFAYGPEGEQGAEKWRNVLEDYTKLGNELYHEAMKDLTPILGKVRAKESARYFRGYNSVITTDCIMNMSCFDNLVKLRYSGKTGHPQKEIHDIVGEMIELVEGIEGKPFETTIKLIKGEL